MGTHGPKTENIQKRRQRVLDAARAIIVAEGVAGLSMRRLAQEAGIVVKTLYNQFGSKEEILTAIVDTGTLEIDQGIAEAARGEQDFRRMFETFETVFLDNAAVFRPAIVASLHLHGFRDDRSVAMHNRRIKAIAAALAAAKANGLIRADANVKVAGRFIYRSYVVIIEDWALGIIGEEEFRLYGRYSVLLAMASLLSESARGLLGETLQELGDQIAAGDQRKQANQARSMP